MCLSTVDNSSQPFAASAVMKEFVLDKQVRKYHKYSRGEAKKQSNNM